MLQHLVNQIHKLLLKNKKTIAVAESCTGGFVSWLLTQLSGSSKYFILGLTCYSNKSKEIILEIPSHLIAKKGSVSKEVACAMASRVRKIAKTDIGIGITGIAGPTGGSVQKAVGTVFIAVDSKNKKICKRFYFTGHRAAIRRKAAFKTLQLLKKAI